MPSQPFAVGCPTKVNPEGSQEARVCPRCHNGMSHVSLSVLNNRRLTSRLLRSCHVLGQVSNVVRVLLRSAHSHELEACVDVRDMSASGGGAAWVSYGLGWSAVLGRLNAHDRWEPQVAQPGYQHPQLQGQYGSPQTFDYGYQPSYTQPPK